MHESEPTIHLHEILEVVEDFHTASLGLVAWELLTEEHVLISLWSHAVEAGLLEPGEPDHSGEDMYVLSDLGRDRLGRAQGLGLLCPC